MEGYLPLERDVCGRWSDQARCSSLPVAASLQLPSPYGLQPERESSYLCRKKVVNYENAQHKYILRQCCFMVKRIECK